MCDKNAELNDDTKLTRCHTPEQLQQWILTNLKLSIPTKSVCPGHHAPFDYLWTSYNEPGADLVVWAPRGGGKTRLAAVATLLDLLHKPGVGVRILGGSMAQSLRLWEHLVADGASVVKDLHKLIKRGRLRLATGSHAEAIAHSQRSVRGLHIQKLRCDELELFDPDVFEAAKLTTRSLKLANGTTARGVIECLSTLHQPWGLMNKVVEESAVIGRRVFRWCILEVLETCPLERDCKTCPLWEDCQGRARNANGFLPIDDAIQLKARASRESWEAEMLCRRPCVRGAVFPTFDPATHVTDVMPVGGVVTLAIDFGFANPFACLWVHDDGVNVHVIDEYVQSARTIDEHVKEIRRRPWGWVRHVACDPAGASRNDQTADSNVDVLRKSGFHTRHRQSKIVDGLELIRRGLCAGSGATTLFIHPRCVNLIRAFRSYHYDPTHPSENPIKDGENDHVIDALRYFYVNRQGRYEMKVVKY